MTRIGAGNGMPLITKWPCFAQHKYKSWAGVFFAYFIIDSYKLEINMGGFFVHVVIPCINQLTCLSTSILL